MSGNFELLDFIGKPQGIVSAFGAIAAALGVVVTIFRVIRRLIRHKRTGKEAKTASADAGPTGLILLSRAALDRILPGAHSRLTRAGLLPEPPELKPIRDYLATLETDLADTWKYVPLPGKQPPDTRIRQTIRLIVYSRMGGDAATPELTMLNKKSRRIRNIAAELRRADEPFVLLGDPGTGKTSTMREIARSMVQENKKRVFPAVVVYAALGSIPSRSKIDQGFIDSFVKSKLPNELQYHYELLHQTGRLIVLFDGMDEMPRASYGEYVKALSTFGSRHATTIKTVFSCRINDFSPEFRECPDIGGRNVIGLFRQPRLS